MTADAIVAGNAAWMKRQGGIRMTPSSNNNQPFISEITCATSVVRPDTAPLPLERLNVLIGPNGREIQPDRSNCTDSQHTE